MSGWLPIAGNIMVKDELSYPLNIKDAAGEELSSTLITGSWSKNYPKTKPGKVNENSLSKSYQQKTKY